MIKKAPLLTIDLESWIFSERINKKNLPINKLRDLDDKYTLLALDYVLSMLKKHNQQITFFVVTRLEEIYPGLIKRILKDGHEVGWHTHTHPNINNASILKKELKDAKKIIKKYSLKGFQAPSVVFFREGYKILKEYGFVYSSSIYGNSNILYNFDGIWEIPISVSNNGYRPKEEDITFPSSINLTSFFRFGIPFGSSLFWSILGKNYYFKKLQEAKDNDSIVNLFMHEWQLVTPKAVEYKKDVSIASNPIFHLFFLPYRINVSKMFEHLLSEFRFQRCIDYLENRGAA